METKFNFKSAICTDLFQSERLLALGLKKETADMVWLNHALTEDYDDWRSEPIYKDWKGWQKDGIPAWSLHRLIEMRLAHDSFVVFQLSNTEDAFEKVISHIEHAIKEGYFNKEYLE